MNRLYESERKRREGEMSELRDELETIRQTQIKEKAMNESKETELMEQVMRERVRP